LEQEHMITVLKRRVVYLDFKFEIFIILVFIELVFIFPFYV